MAEVLHYSRNGVQGPMTSAPPAQQTPVAPHQPPFAPPWLPTATDPRAPFTVDAGIQHKKADAYTGAAVAAAAALGGDPIGRGRLHTAAGPAAPYQKAAAQRAAERAIRPWDPVSGAGERAGAVQLQVPGSNAGVAAFARPNAPTLFTPPAPLQSAAVAAAAGRVGRSGQGQREAEGAVAVRGDAPARELWAAELFQQPPKYCTACRGGHEPGKVGNPEWQPYSPAVRLGNLQLLDTKFRRAMVKGQLCFRLSESPWDPVRWAVQPAVMPPAQFRKQLALALDGVREGHEPFRFLATRAAEGLIASAAADAGPGRGLLVVEAVPELVAPLKLCLNTCQPQLVGGSLLLIIRLLRCHPAVPAALAPYCRHLLPSLAVFRSHRRPMELPAPVCLPSTGTFSGSGAPHGSERRECRVCGAPLYRGYDKPAARDAGGAEPPVWGSPAAAIAAAAMAAGPEAGGVKRLPGRMCRRYTLEALIEEVLGLIAGEAGELGRRVVRSYVPGFTYLAPEAQPSYRRTVEELQESREAAAVAGGAAALRPRRPGGTARSSPRQRPATAGAASAGKGAKVPAQRPQQQQQGRRHSDSGADGGARPGWPSSVLSSADLARWDGIEFRDVPYGQEAAAQGPHAASELLEVAGGGGGTATLRISTPVPVFDSTHDPLYRRLVAAKFDGGDEDPRVGRGGGAAAARVRRGGSGGGGVPRGGNVNAEVPYRASPAGLRRAF